MIREFYEKLNERDFDLLFRIAKEEKIEDIMVKYRDTDKPSKFLDEIMKKEKIVSFLSQFI